MKFSLLRRAAEHYALFTELNRQPEPEGRYTAIAVATRRFVKLICSVAALVLISISPAVAVEFRVNFQFDQMSPDGRTFVVLGHESLRFHELATGNVPRIKVGPEGAEVVPRALNNVGFVVGSTQPITTHVRSAFRWSPNTGFWPLETLAGTFASVAFDVSADGSVVVGTSYTEDGDDGGAFLWTEATGLVDLGVLPGFDEPGASANAVSDDGQVVVGTIEENNGPLAASAYRWTEASGMVDLGDLPGGRDRSYGKLISTDGAVIAGSSESDDGIEPFRWTETQGMISLGHLKPEHDNSYPNAMSADGSVIVGVSGNNLEVESFIWDATHGMRSLDGFFAGFGVDLIGLQLRHATYMSADARVFSGFGVSAGETVQWLVIVPEASTLAILVSAAPLAYLIARKRRCRLH